jgi:hypothetical protein
LPALALLLLAGFAFGLLWLFELRFEGGDIYPPYSSLRSDPLGTMAFFQSLEGLPDLSVRRSYQSWPEIRRQSDCVLLLFGLPAAELRAMPESDFKQLRQLASSGGRVVISLLPVAKKVWEPETPPRKTDSQRPTTNAPPRKAPRKPAKPVKSRDDASDVSSVSLEDKFGFQLHYDDLAVDDQGLSQSELAQAGDAPPGFPPSISWHTAAYFGTLAGNWRTVYRRKDHPVMIERTYGRGTLVLSADSFFLSNEALRGERQPALLAWLIGDKREIIFDETHLGVEEHPGVATLLRRYRLHGLVLGLLALAALFIWKNSASLAPRRSDDGQERGRAPVLGKQSTAGFVNLLRRNVPAPDVLSACFKEWKSACGRDPRAASRLGRVQRIIEQDQERAPASRQPVQSYQAIQQVLSEKK